MMIYVNGDSYATMSDGKRYSEFLGEHYNCASINNAISGSCNSRILRTSLRDLMELKKIEDSIVAVISLTFLLRTELWDTLYQNKFINDGDFKSVQTTLSKRWFYDKESLPINKYKDYLEQWLRWYNVEAETVNLIKEIILLTSWCRLNGIRYTVFSGPPQEPIDFQTPFVESFYKEMINDANVMNIFTNSFTEYCNLNGFVPIDNHTQEIHGTTYAIGHHGEKAHKAFADHLIKNYLNEISK